MGKSQTAQRCAWTVPKTLKVAATIAGTCFTLPKIFRLMRVASQPHCGGCSLVAPRQNRKATQPMPTGEQIGWPSAAPRLSQRFGCSNYCVRVDTIPGKQFLRLARARQFHHRQLVHANAVAAQLARHCVAQPAFRIMVLDCEDGVPWP